jgi:hypothetical protein
LRFIEEALVEVEESQLDVVEDGLVLVLLEVLLLRLESNVRTCVVALVKAVNSA